MRLSLHALFFVSGVTSLVLETIWTRMMGLVFGSSTLAVSTVLTAFMGGLALGGWIGGRRAQRLDRRAAGVALYAALELFISVYALSMPAAVDVLPRLQAALWGVQGSSYQVFALARFALAVVVLAPPAVAMGATLPLLAQALFDRHELGRSIGSLYAINTTGAVVGVVLAGFVLLPSVGTWATTVVVCVTDLLLAGGALLVWRRACRQPSVPAADGAAGPAVAQARPATAPRAAHRWLPAAAVICCAVSGALSMAYEVIWTRVLTLVIGSSTYAFSLMLACFLAGLAGGAALYARRQARGPDQGGNLALVQLLAALGALAGLATVDLLPAAMLVALRSVTLAPSTVFGVKLGLAALLILFPALFLGMVFPAVVQIWAVRGSGAGRTAGDVYALNTVGSIVGSFAAGFVLVPALGSQRSLSSLICGSLALAVTLAMLSSRRAVRWCLPPVAIACAVTAWTVPRWDRRALGAGVFRVSRFSELLDESPEQPRRGQGASVRRRARAWREAAADRVPRSAVIDTFAEPSVGYRVVRQREGINTTVAVARTVDRSLSARSCWVRSALLVNGKPDASLSVLHRRPPGGCRKLLGSPPGRGAGGLRMSASGDAETQVLSGALAYCVHDGREPPRDGLVVGWGSGITVGTMLAAPLRRLTAVELEREVVAAAEVFAPYHRYPLRDPRLALIHGDGRNVLAAGGQRYDIVVSEPSNPWMAGCGNLFTREFFSSVRSALRDRGVFVQWLQAYEIAPRNVWSILATVRSVFSDVHVFSPLRAPTDLLLVARRGGGRLRWSRLERCTGSGGVARQLDRVGIHSASDLLVRLRAVPRGVAEISAGAPLNTDDNARIEFAAPRDLINFQRYSPKAILRRLQETLPDRRVAIASFPAASAASLCRSLLGAGQLRRAAALSARASLPRCAALGRALRRGPPPVDPVAAAAAAVPASMRDECARALSLEPTAALRRLRGMLEPSADAAPGAFAVQAHLLSLLGPGRRYEALQFSLAARAARGAPAAPTYAPLSAVLASLYGRLGRYDLALDEIASSTYPQKPHTP